MDTKTYDKSKWMTIKEALALSGYQNSYLRMKILKENKVPSTKEMIPGTNIPRVLIDRVAFMAWLKSHGTIREDGRKATKVFVNADEQMAVEKLLAELRTPKTK